MSSKHYSSLLTNLALLPAVRTSHTDSLQDLATKHRKGELYRIRPGVYIERPHSYTQEQIALAAALTKIGTRDVISHHSAAQLWGFPSFTTQPTVHTYRTAASNRKGACCARFFVEFRWESATFSRNRVVQKTFKQENIAPYGTGYS